MWWKTFILGTGSDGAPDSTVTRRPYSPPPSNTNVGGNSPPVQPNPSGSIYPQVPSAPSAPSAPSYPGGGSYYPGHDSNGGRTPPAQPNPYDPYGSRDRDPYGGRDPYNGNKNKGSSDDSGSSLSGLFNFLRGGGSSGGTRYGSGGSGSSSGGLSYGDIFNALSGGGSNRGGSGIYFFENNEKKTFFLFKLKKFIQKKIFLSFLLDLFLLLRKLALN